VAGAFKSTEDQIATKGNKNQKWLGSL